MGKSTTVQLAAYLAQCELYKLTLTRGYNLSDFREDLKKVCRMAGSQGISTVFLLTDADIAKVILFAGNFIIITLVELQLFLHLCAVRLISGILFGRCQLYFEFG